MLIVPIVAGWMSGWVVNYFADTLPLTRRLSYPTCPVCGQKTSWLKFLTFQACPHCGRRRGLRSWLVQVLMVAACVYIWIKPHHTGFIAGLVLITYFAVVFVIDLEHRLILHPTSLFGAILGLGLGTWLHGWLPTLEGGLAGFGIMLALYFLGVGFSKFRARRLQAAGQPADGEEALGAGDVILATVLGFILGWPLIWFGLLLGILLGGIIGIFMVIFWFVSGKFKQQAWTVFMPYGPFFILSTFLILFLPNWIAPALPR